MPELSRSENIAVQWVVVIKVPHNKGDSCPALNDPNVADSFWIGVREITYVWEVAAQRLTPESSRVLAGALLQIQSHLHDGDHLVMDSESWRRAFKEACQLIPTPEPGSELVDDIALSRQLLDFFAHHQTCRQDLQFEITYGW
jgi:hypothetical protein